MTFAPHPIFGDDAIRADLFRACSSHPADWVVTTFTERCNRDISGPGFGTEFLLRNGFDVIAVRNSCDDWYVSLSAQRVKLLRQAASPYKQRATYGSSMGAFAAIKFAKPLGASRSIALSPILDISQAWDTRHAADMALVWPDGTVSPRDMISARDISPGIDYHFAVDPRCHEDTVHADMLAGLCTRHWRLLVPFGGHPVGETMRDAGILSPYVLNAIRENSSGNIRVKPVRNERYFLNLARHLMDRGKLAQALLASKRGLASPAPLWEANLVHAQILHRMGQVDEAIPFGAKAMREEPNNPYIVAILVQMMIVSGRLPLAAKWLDQAMATMGSQKVLTEARQMLNGMALNT